MKKAVLAAGALLVIVGATLVVLTSHEELQSAVIPISGMTCENCADHIETALQQLDGMHSAEVNFGESAAKVKYDAVLVTLPGIEKKIEALGYRAAQSGAEKPAGNPSCSPSEAGAMDCCAGKPQKSST